MTPFHRVLDQLKTIAAPRNQKQNSTGLGIYIYIHVGLSELFIQGSWGRLGLLNRRSLHNQNQNSTSLDMLQNTPSNTTS